MPPPPPKMPFAAPVAAPQKIFPAVFFFPPVLFNRFSPSVFPHFSVRFLFARVFFARPVSGLIAAVRFLYSVGTFQRNFPFLLRAETPRKTKRKESRSLFCANLRKLSPFLRARAGKRLLAKGFYGTIILHIFDTMRRYAFFPQKSGRRLRRFFRAGVLDGRKIQGSKVHYYETE